MLWLCLIIGAQFPLTQGTLYGFNSGPGCGGTREVKTTSDPADSTECTLKVFHSQVEIAETTSDAMADPVNLTQYRKDCRELYHALHNSELRPL